MHFLSYLVLAIVFILALCQAPQTLHAFPPAIVESAEITTFFDPTEAKVLTNVVISNEQWPQIAKTLRSVESVFQPEVGAPVAQLNIKCLLGNRYWVRINRDATSPGKVLVFWTRNDGEMEVYRTSLDPLLSEIRLANAIHTLRTYKVQER